MKWVDRIGGCYYNNVIMVTNKNHLQLTKFIDHPIFPDRDSKGLIIHLMDLEISAAVNRRFAEAGGAITPENFMVLAILLQKEGVHQSQLARLTHKNRHNMTRIIIALEEKGYVLRKSDGNDKRRLRVFLTDQGKAVLEEYAPVLAAFKEELFKGICPEKLKAMHQTHLHILSNLGVDL